MVAVVVLVSMAAAGFTCGNRQTRWQMEQRKLLNASSQNNKSERLGAAGREGGVMKIMKELILRDRLCGLVVRVLGYRSGGPVSIPGITRKRSSESGTGSTQPREYN
jgi:hypothetical protein